MKFNEIMRARHIKRWGIVGTTATQNIAEHSFMVALIAEELYATLLGDELLIESNVVRELYELAIWHDMAEIRTGDINSKYKADSGIYFPEEEICPRLQYAREAQSHIWQENIVRLADTMEAFNWIEQFGVKNKHRLEVLAFLADKINGIAAGSNNDFPQFNWYKSVKKVMGDMK